MDPNKRELLLAGNTKGTIYTIKEPGKRDGEWQTKYLDGFAPRAFTSIGLPDDVLASRTVLIPLTRSGRCGENQTEAKQPIRTGNPIRASSGISYGSMLFATLHEIEKYKTTR